MSNVKPEKRAWISPLSTISATLLASSKFSLSSKNSNITFLAYNESTGGATDDDTPGANRYNEANAKQEIKAANEQIAMNNDDDPTNDKPVNEKDFKGHVVDFDDEHSNSNGDLYDSVKEIVPDETNVHEELPNPNLIGEESEEVIEEAVDNFDDEEYEDEIDSYEDDEESDEDFEDDDFDDIEDIEEGDEE